MHGDAQKSARTHDDEKLQSSSPKRESELARLNENIEKKFSELSRYVDRRLGEMELKIEDLAEAVFNQEGDVHEMTASIQSDKGRLQKLDAKEADKFKTMFAKLDKRMDEQLECYFAICLEKTNDATSKLVKEAITVLGTHIDERFQAIEARLPRDAEDNG